MDTIIPQNTPQNNLTPETTYIYALLDPETNEIRYIGKADDPQKRFSRHLWERDDTHKQRWIRDLRSRGLKPLLQIIEEIPFALWQERECYWIAFYRTQGCHLTNSAIGGWGGVHSPETLAEICAS